MPPPSIANTLLAHYDASTLGLADGAAVASWPDLSPSGYNLSQGVAGSRPEYDTGVGPVGGNGVLFRNGRYMDRSGVSIPGTKTIFFVVKNPPNNTNHTRFTFTDDDGLGRGLAMMFHSGIVQWLFGGSVAGGEWIAFTDAALFGANTYWTFVLKPTGAKVRTNGTDRVSGNIANLIGNTLIRLGRSDNSLDPSFTMFEYLIYSGEVSGADILTIEDYLYDKWFVPPAIAESGGSTAIVQVDAEGLGFSSDNPLGGSTATVRVDAESGASLVGVSGGSTAEISVGAEGFGASTPPAFPTTALTSPWIEVWTRPGAPDYGRKIIDLPFLDASVQVPYSGVGKGSMRLPANYDRLDEILIVDKDAPENSAWSTIKVMDDTGWLYEWLPIPRTPVDASKADIDVDFAGEGLEMMWGFARVEPWDWDGSPSFVSTFPDWIWGGKNLLSNPGFEESGETPIIDELWFTGPDPEAPDDDVGGTFILSNGLGDFTVPIPVTATPSQVEARLEEAGIYDDCLVAGSGTESDPWQIEGVVPSREVDMYVDDTGLDPGTTYHIRRAQFGSLQPSGWTKSTTVSSGVPRVFGAYDSWRVVTEEAHSGIYSLRIDPGLVEGSSTRFAGAQQVVQVRPGGIYQAKIWVYPTSAYDTYRFIIRGIDGDFIKSWPGGLTSLPLYPNEWNELIIEDVAVGDNSAVIVRIATTTGGGFDPAPFYIDDAEFNEGMVPTTVGCMLEQLYADATSDHAPGRIVWENEDTGPPVYLTLDFNCEVDSNGSPWDRDDVNQTFKPRMSYLQVIDQIVEEGGYNWRVVPDVVENGTYLLQVYNGGAMGFVVEAGIVGGSSDTSRGATFFAPSSTHMLAEGDGNFSARYTVSGLIEAFGRIEGSILDQNWTTPGSIASAAALALNENFLGAESLVYVLSSPEQRPLAMYRPGDRIRVHDMPIVNEYRRVAQIQLSMHKQGPDEFTVYISDALPFRFIGGAGVKVSRGLVGQAATDNAVAALLKAYKAPIRSPLPDMRIIGGGGQMTVTVAASNATDTSKGKADLQCEGVNDDQQIQQAFDMLGGRGGKVVLSEGRFHFGATGVITPPVPFTLEGMGQGATEIYGDVIAPFFFLNGIHTGENEHQMFRDFSMHGVDKVVSGITVVSTLGSQNHVRVENVVVHDMTGNGISLPRPAGEWNFRRCVFYNNAGAGVYSREAGVDYEDCTFYANGGGGIVIQQDGNGKIMGCFFWLNTGNGISSGNAISQGFGNFIITDNMFLANTGRGIEIQDGDENLISNNIFSNNGSGALAFGAGAFGVANDEFVTGNIQTDSGTFVTVSAGSSAEVHCNLLNGILTDCGAGGGGGIEIGDVAFTHVQGVAASTWTINHTLAFYPNITIVDSVGEQVEGEVTYVDGDTITVEFSAAFSGARISVRSNR